MDYPIVPWHDRSREDQKREFENQALVVQIREQLVQWARAYTRMAAALVDEFGEEEVLDSLEQTWWNLQYEGGLTFREDFAADPQAGMESMCQMWHDGPNQGGTGIVYDVDLKGDRWDILAWRCYHQQAALELESIGGRKIGLSWCMSDMAAVRGWCPKIVMRFPNMQLRGDSFCWQIRQVVEDADPRLDHWSRELSERYGWRSIKALEEK